MNWLFVCGGILFVGLVFLVLWLLAKAYRWDSENAFCLLSIIFILISVFGFTFFGTSIIDNQTIPYSYEYQRAYYADVMESAENSDVVLYYTDIAELNKNLATMQADRRIWGNWSLYPEEILDIKPIGTKD